MAARLAGGLGQPLRIELSTLQDGPRGERLSAAAESAGRFAEALSRPMDARAVTEAFGAAAQPAPPSDVGTSQAAPRARP